MPARSIDTATIAFGLVSIPVKIFSTSERSHELHFNFIHAGCGERLRQVYECPAHGTVERAEMAKGFELTKGSFIELSKDELANLEAVASDEIEMREFVPISAIDPIYVDTTYYLGPAKGGERAYRLLRDAMEDKALAGVAAYSARGKQYVVMLRPFEDGLAMHQLRYRDEIKPWDEVPLGKLPKPPASELALATKVVAQLESKTFDPTRYKDEVKGRVRKLIADKAKGNEILAPEAAERPQVTDLVAALQASLSGEKPATDDTDDAVPTHRRATTTPHRTRASARRPRAKAARKAARKARPASRTRRAHGAHPTKTNERTR